MFIFSIFNLDSFNACLGVALASRNCLNLTASSGAPRILQGGEGHRGLGVLPLPANEFLRFSYKKNNHFSTLFFEKHHAVSAVTIEDAKIFSQLTGMSKSRSLAKINERRLQSLLV